MQAQPLGRSGQATPAPMVLTTARAEPGATAVAVAA
jgi:hypothetical protein